MKFMLTTILLASVALGAAWPEEEKSGGFLPGERVLVEAHNCYPYHRLWSNRIDKALAAEFPLAIELDLMWQADDTQEAGGRLVVAHNEPLTGDEPLVRDYFFERARPLIEAALAEDDRQHWPLITLNINDIRSGDPRAFAELWRLTGDYESWLCVAEKRDSIETIAPLTARPVLVLSNGGRLATEHFYDAVPTGGMLRIFGSGDKDTKADNFRRWINFPWGAVEPEGQRRATEWNEEKAARLTTLVHNAHAQGYWIRFYSMNGHGPVAGMRLGLSPFYNFGSLEAVQTRWEAAWRAGVDFIATDQVREAQAFLTRRAAGE